MLKAHTISTAWALVLVFTALGRGQQSDVPSSAPALRTETTRVMVPALVRAHNGDLVYTLTAGDFKLTDDGVAQPLTLEPETGGEPLALVVVVEIGGAGARQFQKYDTIAPPLAPMLASIVGNVPRQVAVITFDSHPQLLQEFTGSLDEAADALSSLKPGCTRQHHYTDCRGPNPIHDKPLGDNGAAILDSLEYAVALLRSKPAGFRRTILLVSETIDRGSETTIPQAVRDITDTNATIYSIGYSTAKSEAAHYAYRQLPTQPSGRTRLGWLDLENHHPNPPHGCMGKDTDPDPDATKNRWAQAYDCLAQLAPPLTVAKMAAIATVDALQTNVPETVAHLTGGEYFALGDEKHFEHDLATIANHLPNRYVLSFHPHSPHPGPHTLSITLPGFEGLSVTARTTYWAEPASQDLQP
ncbi:VWA domain-containing protein [Acidobacteria bacterium AB60]|nr:VWA domain-containing protein [Acidobacteria bacterium AB60]